MRENDKPISKIEEDKLRLEKDIMALCRFIKESDKPITISIQGEWGSGKTSFMKCVEDILCKKDKDGYFESIWINAWDMFLAKSSEDIVTAVIQQIYFHFAEKDINARKRNRRYRIEDKARFLTKIGAQVVNISVDSVSEFFEIASGSTLIKKKELNNYINMVMDSTENKKCKGVLVFVDDLDRLESEKALSVVEALKVLFDVNNFVFLLAIDQELLERGVTEKYNLAPIEGRKKAFKYFEKVIQLPYQIPIAKYDIVPLVRFRLEGIDFLINVSADKEQIYFDEIIRMFILATGKNPRRINRLLNSLKLAFFSGEDKFRESLEFRMIILILLCFQLSFPEVYDLINKEFDINMWEQYLQVFDESISKEEIQRYKIINKWEKMMYIYLKKDKIEPDSYFKCVELLAMYEKYQKELENTEMREALSILSFSNQIIYEGEAYDRNSEIQFGHGKRFIVAYKNDIMNAKKILDVGCGNGNVTINLWEQNYNTPIDAIDISESQIKVAKEKYSKYLKESMQSGYYEGFVHFKVKDILDLDVNEEYDVIFSSSVLHWVKEQEKAYRNIFNALKAGGKFLSNQAGKKDNIKTYAGIHKIAWKAIEELGYVHKYPNDWEFPMCCYSEQEIKVMLREIGFVDIETKLLEGEEQDVEASIEAFIVASMIFYKYNLKEEYSIEEYEKLKKKFREIMRRENVDLGYKLLYISAVKPLNIN